MVRKAVGQVSLVEALLPTAYGSNQRLDLPQPQQDRASVGRAQGVLLTSLSDELLDGFPGPPSVVAVAEVRPLMVVVDEPGIEIGL